MAWLEERQREARQRTQQLELENAQRERQESHQLRLEEIQPRHRSLGTFGVHTPEELFEYILTYMDISEQDANGWGYTKKQLGYCALVSTYWASRCQAKIFRKITLRDARDVYELSAMLSRPEASSRHASKG